MVSFGVSLSSTAWQPRPTLTVDVYLRQVEQSLQAGDMTLAEQQISAVEQRLRMGTASPGLAGPVLRTVDQYVAQVAEQIRAGNNVSAQQALTSARQYASRMAGAAR